MKEWTNIDYLLCAHNSRAGDKIFQQILSQVEEWVESDIKVDLHKGELECC